MKKMKEAGKIRIRLTAIITAFLLMSGLMGGSVFAQEAVAVPVSEISLVEPPKTICIDETTQLSYKILPVNATSKSAKWTSEDESIATVTPSGGFVTGLKAGKTKITVTAGDKEAACEIEVLYVAPTGFTLSKSEATMYTGATLTLSAAFKPANTTDKVVVWASDKEHVLTVDENGKVTSADRLGYTAKSKGAETVTITAKAEANKAITKKCIITVKPRLPNVIRLFPSTMDMGIGEKKNIEFFLTPEDTKLYKDTISVTSSNKNIATAVMTEDLSGEEPRQSVSVTAIKQGKATITLTTSNGKTDKCVVTVISEPPELTFAGDASYSRITKDGAFNVRLYVEPRTASGSIVFESTDVEVAKVNGVGKVTKLEKGQAGYDKNKPNKGVITAKITPAGPGTCKITARSSIATDPPVRAEVTVTVNEQLPTEYALDKAKLVIRAGSKAEQLKLKANSLKPNKADTVWQSSDTRVATVSKTGLVTGHRPGQTVISLKAASGAKETTCLVTVKDRYDNDSFSKATVVSENAVISDASIYPSGDVDHFKFTLSANKDVTINLIDVPDGCEYDVALHEGAGNKPKIAAHSLHHGNYKSLTKTLAKGTYYVKVTSAKGHSPEFYRLQVLTGPSGSMPASVAIGGAPAPGRVLKYGDVIRLTAAVAPFDSPNKSVIWTSSAPSVAKVSANGVLEVVSSAEEASATIKALTSFGGAMDSFDINVKNIPVDYIGILPDSESLSIGRNSTLFLRAETGPPNASDKNVSWSSSDSGVASVSGDGIVTGTGEGTAVITALAESGGKQATRTVTVKEIRPDSIKLSKEIVDLKVNSTMPLVAAISPADVSDKTVVWESDDPSVVSVRGGTLYGESEGTATVTATTEAEGENGQRKEAVCTVNVTIQPATGVSVSPSSLSIAVGQERKLTGAALPNTASDKSLTWESSDEGVATVDGYGLVTAVGAGTAEITASPEKWADAGIFSSCSVTVSEEVLAEEVAIFLAGEEAKTAEMDVGGAILLTAQALPQDATNKGLVWRSSDTTIATVTSGGAVYGVGEGKATITASSMSGSASASLEVEVKYVAIEDIGIHFNGSAKGVDRVYLDRKSPETYTFSAALTPENATSREIIWSNSDARIGEISESGVFRPKNDGNTTITAASESGEKIALCRITVISGAVPPTGVTIQGAPLKITLGNSVNLRASVAPAKCINKEVTWSLSGGADIASIDEDGVFKTHGKPGKVTVYATAAQPGKDNKGNSKLITAKKTITVEPVKPKSVTIKPAGVIRPGETVEMAAVAQPENITDMVTVWNVIQPPPGTTKFATIDKDGKLTALKRGTVKVKAMVYAKDDPKQGRTTKSKTVSVKIVIDPDKLAINQAKKYQTAKMKPSETQQLLINIEPAGAANREIAWSCNPEGIVTVSKKGLVKAVGSGAVEVTGSIELAKPNGSEEAPLLAASCMIEVETIPPTGLKLNNSKALDLGVTQSKTVPVVYAPAKATKGLRWASSDDGIATVNEKGVVKGISAGRVTITAYSTVEGCATAKECVVTVRHIPPSSVKIGPVGAKSIFAGNEASLKATVLPAGCSDKSVTWTSNNDRVVTVDAESGRIKAVNPGVATVKATTNMAGANKKLKTASFKITVKPVKATKLTVTPSSVNLSANNTQQLSFDVRPANVTENVPVYKSSNTKIAIVSPSGLITGLKLGTATISVKVGGKTATCMVKVTTDPPTGITLTPTSITLFTGETQNLTHAVKPKSADQSVSYSSSSPLIAVVTDGSGGKPGTIKAISPGVCEISVKSDVGNYEEVLVVTVFDRPPGGGHGHASLTVGGSRNLAAELGAASSGMAPSDWIWASGAPDVADVTQDGLVTAKAPGNATVIAATLNGDRVTFEVEVK